MNSKENQYVNSAKWMLLLSLTVLIFMLVLVPTGKHANENQIVRARQNAEVLGLQLAQIYTQSKSNRGPASASELEGDFKGEGLIGLDPWGQPYKYNILKTDQGVARIVVMSDGPGLTDPQSQSGLNADESSEKIRIVITPGE